MLIPVYLLIYFKIFYVFVICKSFLLSVTLIYSFHKNIKQKDSNSYILKQNNKNS